MLIQKDIYNGKYNLLNFLCRYYFKIKNTIANKKITLNICNFTKADSLYKKVILELLDKLFKGMKPYVFS